jgi:hypothetical protein
MYIMSNRWYKLKQRILQAFKMRIPESLLRFLVPRVHHMPT